MSTAVELLTTWHIAVLPSLAWVGGVTPRPVGLVIWVTAEVIGGFQCIFREFRHIIAGVLVRALAVPALASPPGFGERYLTVIIRTPHASSAVTGTCVRRDSLSDTSEGVHCYELF